MSQEEFSAAFKHSPMMRATLRGLKRDAAVVLGNLGTAPRAAGARRTRVHRRHAAIGWRHRRRGWRVVYGAHLLMHDPFSSTPFSMSTTPDDPRPTPTPTPTPDLSASAERLLTTVVTAAESAVVRAGTDLEARLARGLTSLNDRLTAALRATRG